MEQKSSANKDAARHGPLLLKHLPWLPIAKVELFSLPLQMSTATPISSTAPSNVSPHTALRGPRPPLRTL